ncbi:MAG: zinc-dependent peptidase [Bacteroidota bacterium]
MPEDSIKIPLSDTMLLYRGQGSTSPGYNTDELTRSTVVQLQQRSYEEDQLGLAIPFGVFLTFILVVIISRWHDKKYPSYTIPGQSRPPISNRKYQVFHGSKLQFTPEILDRVLYKYFVYYRELAWAEKQRFIRRLQAFMSDKTFTIPADEGYREMPMLVSASAIQLTFGLRDFKLPWYENICVHPAEYVLANPLRTLAGNVSGKTITLSWKHFFEDYQKADGVNVGLHEMAHALQMQHEHFYKRKGKDFRIVYDLFESLEDHIVRLKNTAQKQLYSGYALTSIDEFWACSVEIFFEQPELLLQQHPNVYDIIKIILKQDPANSKSLPCIPI